MSKSIWKNLFSKKKGGKQDENYDRLHMPFPAPGYSRVNQENERPSLKKSQHPLDAAATACYHSEVAPRTRRGPKSCPGGSHDDEMTNRSFQTEIFRPRRRAASPDYGRENKRSSLAGRGVAFSEFNGPVSRRRDLEYRTVTLEEEDDEDLNVSELKNEVRVLKRRLVHTQNRKEHYKRNLDNLAGMKESTEQAYKSQAEANKSTITDLKQKNEMLEMRIQTLERTYHQQQQMLMHCRCGRIPQPTYSFSQIPPSSFSPFLSAQSHFPPLSSGSICTVADPQPTRNDLCHPFPQMDFTIEDKDETKVFTCETTSTADLSEFSHSQME